MNSETIDSKEEKYYFVTDRGTLYRQIGKNLSQINFKFIETEAERVNGSIIPVDGIHYYVWETNELWIYSKIWIIVAGSNLEDRSYYHGVKHTIDSLKTGAADNNGLLGDGSVIIRDVNKTIKGRLFADIVNNRLVLSSFIGGGFKFVPYGITDTITTIPNAIFKYDESGNIEKIEYPEIVDLGYGEFSLDVINNADDSKTVKVSISDTIFMERDFIINSAYDPNNKDSKPWIPKPDKEATIRIDGNVEVTGNITQKSESVSEE